MFTEQLKNGNVRYGMRYKNPHTMKSSKVSIVMDKDDRKNRKLAEQILNERIKKICSGIDNSILTFDTLVNEYLKEHKDSVKPSTYRRDYGHCMLFIKIIGADTIVSTITARFIKERINSTGKPNVTKNEYLKHLKSVLKWGYRNDYIDSIEFLQKIENYPDPGKKERKEERYLEEDEVKLLLKHIKKSSCTTWIDLTEFLLLSGVRIGEAISLENKDIDKECIHVSKTYDINNRIVTDPKTYSSIRDVYIQNELDKKLKQIKAHNRMSGIKSNYLFFDNNGNHMHYDAYRKWLGEQSKKAINRRIVPHALRHTHASMLLANGVTIDAISRRLGHADIKVTVDKYIHILEKLKYRDNQQIKNVNLIA